MPTPVQGGRVGRTDMGVDVSGSPGATLIDPVPGRSQLVGKIGNWFQGQPLYVWQVVSGAFKDRFWYVAEQVNIATPQGGQVDQGQPIGTYAASGTATEWGWAADASGRTLAQATSGYTEGQVTPAGQQFKQQIIAPTSGAPVAPDSPGGPYGLTRPGGGAATPAGGAPASSGQGVAALFTAYEDELTTPRTAPKTNFVSLKQGGWKAPFQWWYTSFLGKNASGSGAASTSSSTASTPPANGLPSGGQSHGIVSKGALRAIGASHGWSGQQIDDWMNVISSESDGTLTDTNPSSGAYGIAQGITGPKWYYQYGGNPNTLRGQLTAMANYMSQRYGDPSAAWAFHQKNNWY